MRDLPKGVIDTHTHAGPDVVPRLMNDHALVAAARDAGYRGIVLKSHVEGTASRAALAKAAVWPDGDVQGGIVLNRHSLGGLNPVGVSTALALGARIIWLPTLSSIIQSRHASGPARHALPRDPWVTDDPIDIGPELLHDGTVLAEIFRLVAGSDATLATGHLDPTMLVPVVRFAVELGVSRIVVTHPEAPFLNVPLDAQLALAELPSVWFERCYLSVLNGVSITKIAEDIRAVPPGRTILASDLGQPGNPAPVDGLTEYARRLSHHGISDADLEMMLVHNPAAALGLDEP